MSYEDRDTYGMYKNYDEKGPGPRLMGAIRLLVTTSIITRTKTWAISRRSCWT